MLIKVLVKSLYFGLLGRLGKLVSSEDEYRMLRELVLSGSSVIDVGANIGRYSLELSRIVGNNGLVIAIEPNKNIVPIFLNILSFCGRKNVSLINAGCGKVAGMGTFLVNTGKPSRCLFSTQTRSVALAKVGLDSTIGAIGGGLLYDHY